MKSIDGIGFVIIRLAIFPRVIEPTISLQPIAAEVLIVAALMASAGIRRILMHASEMANFMSPEGVEPGF